MCQLNVDEDMVQILWVVSVGVFYIREFNYMTKETMYLTHSSYIRTQDTIYVQTLKEYVKTKKWKNEAFKMMSCYKQMEYNVNVAISQYKSKDFCCHVDGIFISCGKKNITCQK